MKEKSDWVTRDIIKMTRAEKAIQDINEIIKFTAGVMAASHPRQVNHDSYSAQNAIVSIQAIYEINVDLIKLHSHLLEVRDYYDNYFIDKATGRPYDK
jgi:hypothetical protein